MTLSSIFIRYERLVAEADKAFGKMLKGHGSEIKCKAHCSDCCHAVFGLFIVEAASIKNHFDRLDRKERRAALALSAKAHRDLLKIEESLRAEANSSNSGINQLAKARVRCPLLDAKEECILYEFRPITCRVYGIPTSIKGKARVCSQSGFKDGETYPTFDLDRTYRDLYLLSKELLERTGAPDPERGSLLISLPKAIETPIKELITGFPGKSS
jgi:Fe-S-cluster containining protein